MTKKRALLFAAIASFSLLACEKGSEPSKDEAPKPGASAASEDTENSGTAKTGASAEATEKAATASKCEPIGCSGAGDFFKMCDCKAKPQPVPVTIKNTGKYGFGKKPQFEVTNTTDKPLHWGSAAVYYYDKSGKQQETTINDKPYKVARVNGSNFTLKPKETKTMELGFSKENEPKGFDAMQVVIDGWCFGTYEDKASHLCINNERAPDERAKAAE